MHTGPVYTPRFRQGEKAPCEMSVTEQTVLLRDMLLEHLGDKPLYMIQRHATRIAHYESFSAQLRTHFTHTFLHEKSARKKLEELREASLLREDYSLTTATQIS